MYNRYIRNDSGDYTRIREDSPNEDRTSTQGFTGGNDSGSGGPGQSQSEARNFSGGGPPPSGNRQEGDNRRTDGLSGFLRHILDQFHLESIDSGDLILLGLLFLLYRENADEELLIALGLLLIL